MHEHVVVHDACNKSMTHASCQGIIFIKIQGCHFFTDNLAGWVCGLHDCLLLTDKLEEPLIVK